MSNSFNSSRHKCYGGVCHDPCAQERRARKIQLMPCQCKGNGEGDSSTRMFALCVSHISLSLFLFLSATLYISLSIYRKSDKTVTNLDLTTKDNVTRGSFKKHIKRFAFIVASSVVFVTDEATIKAKRFICFLKEHVCN